MAKPPTDQDILDADQRSLDLLGTHAPSQTIDPISSVVEESDSADSELFATFVPTGEEPDFLATQVTDDNSIADQVCKSFTKAWESDTSPNWHEFLPDDASETLRNFLAYQLVKIDVEQRQSRNQSISHEQYLSKVPHCRRAIQSALTRPSGSVPEPRHRGAVSTPGSPKSGSLDWSMETTGSHQVRYKPLAMHAKGGLGAVYRGKDMELGRVVALKRILPDREDNADTRARFIFEAEVTGSLEHPGIVPVYGLGQYENDRPYYAMRFVRGTSFTEAIKAFHQSDTSPTSASYYDREFRQLIRRLVDCCNALHFAHDRGIVHRDIKPDNIMLGRYGETLVVDWGLAKRMTENIKPQIDPSFFDSTEGSVNHTCGDSGNSEGSIVGTPMFMSPEQAFGIYGELTGSADVYSLGAMLFQIIGNAYSVEATSTRDVVLKVREGDLKDLALVAPNAPRALVSICKKAMETGVEDRYDTAASMADDLERWMSGEAVEAHTESLVEKSFRLLWRYRAQAVSAAIALMTITVVTLISMIFVNQAKKSEEVAKLQATQFKGEAIQRYRGARQAIDSWLVESSDALEYFPGTRSVRLRLLTLATEDYEEIAGITSEDPELELERGRVLIRLGDLKRTGKQFETARSNYQEAIGLFDDFLGSSTSNQFGEFLKAAYAIERGNASARMALNWASEDQLDKAEVAFTQAITDLTNIQTPGLIAMRDRYRGAALVNWADVAVSRNQTTEAKRRIGEAIASLATIGSEGKPSDHLLLARAQEMLGRTLVNEGKHREASGVFEDSAKVIDRLVKQSPDQPGYLDALASVLVSQSLSQRQLGDEEGAIASLVDAATQYRSLVRAIPDMPRHQENLALTLTDLGWLYYEKQLCRDADVHLNEAGAIVDELLGNYGVSGQFKHMQAACSDIQGLVQSALGNNEAAVQSIGKAIGGYQSLTVEFPDQEAHYERLALSQSHLASVLAASSSPESIELAQQGFDASISLLEELTDVYPEIPRYRSTIAYVYEAYGRFLLNLEQEEAAKDLFGKAESAWVELGDQRDPSGSARCGWLLLTCGVPELQSPIRASQYAMAAVEASPENDHFQSLLAASLILSDKDYQSEPLLKPLFEKEPKERSGSEWFVFALQAKVAGQSEQVAAHIQSANAWFDAHCPYHPDIEVWTSLITQYAP